MSLFGGQPASSNFFGNKSDEKKDVEKLKEVESIKKDEAPKPIFSFPT